MSKELLNELSKKTLSSYVTKAAAKQANASKIDDKVIKRHDGITKAVNKLSEAMKQKSFHYSGEDLKPTIKKKLNESETMEKEINFNDLTEDLKEGFVEYLIQEGHDLESMDEEQLNELSKKTLGSYVKKAKNDALMSAHQAGAHSNKDELTVARKRSKGIDKAVNKLTEEQLASLKESFKEFNLDEKIVENVVTLFQAAINDRCDSFEQELAEQYEAAFVEAQEALQEQVDQYVQEVASQWLVENQLPIQQNIRLELMESFIEGLHGLFTEHYIEVPEEKVDAVHALAEQNEELKEKCNQFITEAFEAKQAFKEVSKQLIINEQFSDLTMNQREKLKNLAENIDYSDEADLIEKVSLIKDKFLNESKEPSKDSEKLLKEEVVVEKEQKQISVNPTILKMFRQDF